VCPRSLLPLQKPAERVKSRQPTGLRCALAVSYPLLKPAERVKSRQLTDLRCALAVPYLLKSAACVCVTGS